MHEFGIIENIFKVIEKTAEDNGLSRISKVRLKIGKMRQVVPELMQNAFAIVSEQTIANGAVLEIEKVPIRMKCLTCGGEFMVREQEYICPECGSVRLETLSGQELVLESVEGEK